MNKSRIFSALLMIIAGIALVASPARSAVDVGVLPEYPCEQYPSLFAVAVLIDPCQTPSTRPEVTTPPTTAPSSTTTEDQPTTTVDRPTTTVTETTVTPTTAPASSTTAAPTGVGGQGANRPPTATQGGALARTGSSTAPITAAGIALAGLGVVLLVTERRRAAARA